MRGILIGFGIMAVSAVVYLGGALLLVANTLLFGGTTESVLFSSAKIIYFVAPQFMLAGAVIVLLGAAYLAHLQMKLWTENEKLKDRSK